VVHMSTFGTFQPDGLSTFIFFCHGVYTPKLGF